MKTENKDVKEVAVSVAQEINRTECVQNGDSNGGKREKVYVWYHEIQRKFWLSPKTPGKEA